MPELPEVETVRRGVAPALEGRRITRVIVRRRDLRRPLPPDFETCVTGARVHRVARRAKYLLLAIGDDRVVVIHLGMSGRLTLVHAADPPGPHDHVDLVLGDGTVARFCDPRRFGLVLLATESTLERHPLFAHLGPEPLSAAFDGAYLAAALAGRRQAVKTALLDQRLVVGLGNIYVCEALHRAGIAPERPAGGIARADIDRLVADIRTVLRDAVAAGGSSLRDHRQASGELGYFQHNFRIYGREGEDCLTPGCGGLIRRRRQGGRSTFYCPACQH